MFRRQGRQIALPIDVGSHQYGFVETIHMPPEVSMAKISVDPYSDQTVIQYMVEVPRILRVSNSAAHMGPVSKHIEWQVERDVATIVKGELPLAFVKSEEEPQFMCIECSL